MTNPFEAAIKLLAHAYRPPLESGAQCGSTLEIGRAGQEFTDEQHKQFLATIRVLEAAGKVDKELAIKTLRRLYHPRFNQGDDPVSVPIFDAIMPLLETLPDKEPR